MRFGFCRVSSKKQRVTDAEGVTRLVDCDPQWGQVSFRRRAVEEGDCGCVECLETRLCNRATCDPKQMLDPVTVRCKIECKDIPLETCSPLQQILMANESSQTVYVTFAGFYEGFLLSPGEHTRITDAPANVKPLAALAAAPVGDLNDAESILRVTHLQTRSLRMKVQQQGIESLGCASYQFSDVLPPVCPPVVRAAPADEARLLKPVQGELNAYLNTLSLGDTVKFLHEARVYFMQGDRYMMPASANGNFFFRTEERLGPPDALTFARLEDEYFELRLPTTLPVSIGGPPPFQSTRMRLALSRPSSPPGTAVTLQRIVSFYPSRPQGIFAFGSLPFKLEDGTPGLDHATLVLVSLSATSRDVFLKASPASAVQCCVGGTYNSYARAVCDGSSFTGGTGNCDDLLAAWCKSPLADPDRAQVCGCYESVAIANPVQRQMLEAVEKQGVPFARKCLVSECVAGLAYKSHAMREAPCPGLCVQIQNLLNHGDLSQINFAGQQVLACGEDGTLLTRGGLGLPASSPTGLALLLYVAGALVLLLGCLLMWFAQRGRPAWQSLPVLAALLLVLFGLLVQFHVL